MTRNILLHLVIISLLLCCVFSSCNQKKVSQGDSIPVIQVDLDNRQVDKAITIKEVIPLETSDDCLIGYVAKAIYWNNKIIVLDNYKSNSMFVFNDNGQLDYKTTKGKGPGEISDPEAVTINERDSTILLFDNSSRKLLEYNSQRDLLSSNRIKGIIVNDIFPLRRDTFLVYHSQTVTDSEGEKRQTTYSVCTENFSKVKHLDILLNRNKLSSALWSPVEITSDEILFVAPWSYNIYELQGDDFRAKYQLDFGDAALTQDQRENLSSMEIIPLVREGTNPNVGCLISVFKNNHVLVVCAEYGINNLTIIHNLKDKNTFTLDAYIDEALIPQCNVWGLKDDGSIYALVEAEDFIEFNESTHRYDHLDVSAVDNPILISFQIEGLF